MPANQISIGITADPTQAQTAFKGLTKNVQAETQKVGSSFDRLGDRLRKRFERKDIKELGNVISGSIMNLATGGSVADVVGAAGLTMGVSLATQFVIGAAQKIAESAAGQAIISAFGTVVTALATAAEAGGTLIGTIIPTAASIAMAIWPALLVAAIVAGIVFLINNPKIVDDILNFAKSVLDWIVKGLATLGQILMDLFGKAWQLVVDGVGFYLKTVVNFWLGLPGLIGDLLRTLPGFFGKVFDAVLGVATGIIGHIVDAILGIIDKIKVAIGWLDVLHGKQAEGQGGNVFGNIPHHAAGGWVGLHGPELAMVGEKGPEYIVPNHDLGRGAQGSRHTLFGDVYLDGQKVGKVMDGHNARKARLTPVRQGA